MLGFMYQLNGEANTISFGIRGTPRPYKFIPYAISPQIYPVRNIPANSSRRGMSTQIHPGRMACSGKFIPCGMFRQIHPAYAARRVPTNPSRHSMFP